MVRGAGREFGVGDWTQPRLGVVHYATFEAWHICVHLDQFFFIFFFKHPVNVIAFFLILSLPCVKMVGLVSNGWFGK